MRTNELFRDESSDPKLNAQSNLCGRTHYVDDATLAFHKSRILVCRVLADGLILGIVESYSVDLDNTERAFRHVLFDVFGTVLSRSELRDGLDSRQKALLAMYAAVDLIDPRSHTLVAIERERYGINQELDALKANVSSMSVLAHAVENQ
jgi:hypothetical protein